ncbi:MULTISPECIES: host specificity factor TipJ family phage tail protein [unclassified Pseudomonas]|uniref:host specificity factor TipJ family phage tail protein n=1 Tax=unclassified Pseudomonas TaxID=196821 RepID=UPI000C86C44D|nr:MULTISPECIES: host specificity factor TipJ family phage tail protein [unclassified Pseudomonas]PMV86012.1 hypothetical protein C1X56_16360 [Pseudomonas sp. GW101-1A09]PMV90727.1 hypothetical protein C1X51_23650 [Pseudomonas sp. FW306-2-2C-B10A]PMV97353.1 hypothetical protein C1X55_16690 [Pseudomonas sp. GW460-C8]PMW05454.1 hypothetical protein C1X50_12565 [Pseudomonas sp. MPR-TSA4]PMW15897.1 hypothetical protein C1X52_12770 [Pseudomonas sp. FW306-2-1A-C05A]
MIDIYANKLDQDVLREYRVNTPTTLEQWLTGNVKGYERREVPPMSIAVNGCLSNPSDWAETNFGPDDHVQIWIEPKGTDPVSITIAAIKGIQAVMKLITPRVKLPKTGNPTQGSSLSGANAKANQVRYGDPVRELFGEDEIFPDYIVEPRRKFKGPKDEWQYMMLCVTRGECEILPSDIKIGNTPIIALGSNATYRVYGPGEDVSAEPAAQWWYQATEVGVTATGTSGLDLKTTTTVPQAPSAQAFQFNNRLITIPTGAGSFPAGWAIGMIIRIEVMYQYTVTAGGGVGGRDLVTGPLEQLGAFPGMQIEVVGANAGRYLVNSYTAPAGGNPAQMTLNTTSGAPVSGLQSGVGWASIGYTGLRYRITAASTSQISVERLTSAGLTDGAWPGFSFIESNSAVLVLDNSNLEGDWSGPYALCPPAEKTTKISFTVMFPSGLAGVTQKGVIVPWSVTYEFQYRDMAAAGAWSSYVETITQSTLDQIGFTRELTIGAAIRPEGRMRRIGAKSTETNIQDNIQWYDARTLLPSPTSYPGWTTIAVSAAGGGKLSSQSENKVSVVATRKLPVLVDGAWTPDNRVTRDIAPVYNYIARAPGYDAADIDFEELATFDSICKLRGDKFDLSVESFMTVKEGLNTALAAGFAEFTISRGRLRPVRDQKRDGFDSEYFPAGTQGYSAQNLIGPLKISFKSPDPAMDHDGVDVEYKDRFTRQTETVKCRLPGQQGIKAEKVKAIGIGDRNRAYRLGMRRASEARYRRWSYSFETELDGNNSDYLGLAGVSDDTPGRGQSALMLGFTPVAGGVILESSEPFIWIEGISHTVGIRRLDGTLSGPWVATRVNEYQLSIPSIDFVPDTSWNREPPHLLFGPVSRECHRVLVSKVSPKGSESVSVQGFNYDERVYLYDDSSAPV